MRILGIDPGSTVTGYGVVERSARGPVHVAHGTLRPPPKASLAERLAKLHTELVRVIEIQQPDVAVVERIFVSASARSALVLGHARGVVLATVGSAGLPLREYAAQQIKQAVVGTGGARKHQVQAMVRRILSLSRAPAQDAADALAAAICHAHQGPLAELAPRGRAGSRARRRSEWVVRRAR